MGTLTDEKPRDASIAVHTCSSAKSEKCPRTGTMCLWGPRGSAAVWDSAGLRRRARWKELGAVQRRRLARVRSMASPHGGHPLPHHALRWHVLPVHSTAAEKDAVPEEVKRAAGSARQRATPRSGRPPASRRPGSARLSSPHLPFAPLEISDCPLCTSQRGREDG